MAKEKQIKVKLVRGLAGKDKKQKMIVASLGIRKVNQERVHKDNPVIRGMIRRVLHLVKTIEE